MVQNGLMPKGFHAEAMGTTSIETATAEQLAEQPERKMEEDALIVH
jgi:hypothetical protein